MILLVVTARLAPNQRDLGGARSGRGMLRTPRQRELPDIDEVFSSCDRRAPAYTLTGMSVAPRRLIRPFQRTRPDNANPGNLVTSRLIATRPSRRASAEPRQ